MPQPLEPQSPSADIRTGAAVAAARGGNSPRPLSMAPAAPPQVADDAPVKFISTGSPSEGDVQFMNLSGGGGPTMAQMNDATLSVSGGRLIGSSGMASLGGISQGDIRSVTWSVSGAKASQSYTPSSGTTTDLASPITHTLPGASDRGDSISYIWNETAGNHQVSGLITYDDGSTDSVSTTISVAEPTVNSFVVSVENSVLGTHNGVIGGRITLFSPGIQYTAKVTVPANTEGGVFGFLQKCNLEENQTNANTGVHTVNTGWVLDNWTGAGAFHLIQGKTFSVAAGATTSTPSRTDNPGPPADDAPSIPYHHGGGTDICTAYSIQDQFQTYLMFKPDSGIWVKIAETNVYSLNGSATWNAGDAKFTGTTSISTSSPTTTPGTGFVSWTDYYTNVMNNYNPAY